LDFIEDLLARGFDCKNVKYKHGLLMLRLLDLKHKFLSSSLVMETFTFAETPKEIKALILGNFTLAIMLELLSA